MHSHSVQRVLIEEMLTVREGLNGRPVRELFDTERGLDDASGLDSGPENILLRWNVVFLQQSIHVVEIAVYTGRERNAVEPLNSGHIGSFRVLH